MHEGRRDDQRRISPHYKHKLLLGGEELKTQIFVGRWKIGRICLWTFLCLFRPTKATEKARWEKQSLLEWLQTGLLKKVEKENMIWGGERGEKNKTKNYCAKRDLRLFFSTFIIWSRRTVKIGPGKTTLFRATINLIFAPLSTQCIETSLLSVILFGYKAKSKQIKHFPTLIFSQTPKLRRNWRNLLPPMLSNVCLY